MGLGPGKIRSGIEKAPKTVKKGKNRDKSWWGKICLSGGDDGFVFYIPLLSEEKKNAFHAFRLPREFCVLRAVTWS